MLSIALHIDCPCCGYDLYSSPVGHCPECGLVNSGGLLDEYQEHRYPAMIEWPQHAPIRAAIQTLASKRIFASLARDFPSSAARKFGIKIMLITVAAVIPGAVLSGAFVSSMKMGISDYIMRPTTMIRIDGPNVVASGDILRGLLSAPSAILSTLLTWIWVRRRSIKQLNRAAGIAEQEGQRYFALTCVWLSLTLLSWDMGSLIGLFVLHIYGVASLAMLAWIAAVLLPWKGWTYSFQYAALYLSPLPAAVQKTRNTLAVGGLAPVLIFVISRVVFEGITYIVASRLGYAEAVKYLNY